MKDKYKLIIGLLLVLMMRLFIAYLIPIDSNDTLPYFTFILKII